MKPSSRSALDISRASLTGLASEPDIGVGGVADHQRHPRAALGVSDAREGMLTRGSLRGAGVIAGSGAAAAVEPCSAASRSRALAVGFLCGREVAGRAGERGGEIEPGLLDVALGLESEAAVDIGRRHRRIEPDRFRQVDDRALDVAAPAPGVAAVGEGDCELRLQLDRLVEVADGAVVVALQLVDEAAGIEVVGIVGLQPDRLVEIGECAGVVAFARIDLAAAVDRGRTRGN